MGLNKLNKTLWGMVKVAIYCLIVMGIVGSLTLFVVIPQWVKSTEVLVPNIVGKTFFQAVHALNTAGLSVEKMIQEASSPKPIGSVVDQDPPANFSIKPDHKVRITVSVGAKLTHVPSVIGKSEDAAHETLKNAGYLPTSVAHVHSDNYLPDTVIAQNPAEGQLAERDAKVNLLVSLGRKPKYIQLPDLQNEPINEVLPVLEALGLYVEIKIGPHPIVQSGNIITHEKLVRTGDVITLEVSGKNDQSDKVGRLLTHKHTVSDEGTRSLAVKIVVVDDYGNRKVLEGSYSPGTVIDLENRRVKVFGPTVVIVFEDNKKIYERHYQ